MLHPKVVSDVFPLLDADRQQALAHLLVAHKTALELGLPALDFACQLSSLHALHVTDVTLRWLICEGLVGHYLETTRDDDERRAFRLAPNTRFTDASCFILIPAGLALAQR